MSGTLVIWSLVAHDGAVLAKVPIARIKEGELPVNTILPAIEIKRIDAIPRNTVAMTEPHRMHTERVQVTVLAKRVDGNPGGLGKKGCDALLALVLSACPNRHGTVAGVDVVDIRPDGYGPDLSDQDKMIDASSYDFLVRWRS